MKLYWIDLVASIFLVLGKPIAADSTAPSATIDAGLIIGTTTSFLSVSTAVNQFLGVPFATPPERFSAPQKAKSWSQPLDTKEKKGACMQQFPFPELIANFTKLTFNNPPPEESEDCLYLNVYAPASPAPKGGRAVLFWIFGGGFYFGSGSNAFYDGSHFAALEDVIVVATNYRTNVFGFTYSPEIPLQERNLGFLDQRFALDWVQRNIHAFGGDPSKVTIFGESAGSFSVEILLTSFSKNSTPPFRAAIMQSGQISYRGSPSPGLHYPDGEPSWNALVAALNCTGQQSELACVKKAPATTIQDILNEKLLPFPPAYDNKTLLSDPAAARVSGNIARIPILGGTNADEGRFLVYGRNNMTAYLQSLLGPRVDPTFLERVRAVYPVGAGETDYDAMARIERDVSFQCGAALVANETAAIGIPSWRYFFNATFPNTQQFPNGRAYHSSEIPLVFSTYPTTNVTTQEYALSNYMRGAWARFAKDPEAGPGWNAIGTGPDYLDGEADLDVAILGNGGGGAAGPKVVSQSELDGNCALWADVLKGKV